MRYAENGEKNHKKLTERMFFPDSINLSDTEQYSLAIRLEDSQFAFAIRNPKQRKGYIYRSTSFRSDTPKLAQLQKNIFDLDFLTRPYREVWVETVSSRYTFVPQAFFSAKNKELYLGEATEGENRHALYDHLENEQMCLIFDLDKEIYEFLVRSLSSPRFTHHSGALIRQFNIHPRKTELFARMHLYFRVNGETDAIIIRNGTIVTVQTLGKMSPANLLYSIMNLWKVCNLNQLTDRLFLSGNLQMQNDLMPLLNRFLAHVEERGIPPEAHLLGDDADKTPFDLFGLLL